MTVPAAVAAPGLVVVVSVDPRRGEGARALGAWRALGATAVSVNAAAEWDALRAAGIDPGLPPVADADTGLALWGRAVPLFLPALAAAAARHPGRPLLLADADLHPAVTGLEAFARLAEVAPFVALTRDNCALLEGHALSEPAPERRSVDAVLLRPDAAGRLLAHLAAFPVARRMAWGVHGAGPLLAALARTPGLGGRIVDAPLLHERHAAADAGELVHYVGALHLLRATTATDPVTVAADVAAAVAAGAAETARFAAALRLAFYARPPVRPASPEALAVAAAVAAAVPAVRWTVPFVALSALAGRVLRGEAGRERIDAVLPAEPEGGGVAAVLFERLCRVRGAPALTGPGLLPPDSPLAALRDALADGSPEAAAALGAVAGEDERPLLALIVRGG